MTTPEAFAELMAQYNKARSEWIAKLGAQFNEGQFHEWFTKQVRGEQQ